MLRPLVDRLRLQVLALSACVLLLTSQTALAQLLQVFVEPQPSTSAQLGGAVVGVNGLVAVSAPGNDILGNGSDVYLFDPDTADILTSIPAPVTGRRYGDSLAALPGALAVAFPNAIITPGVGSVQGAVYIVDAIPSSGSFGEIVRTLISPQSDPEFGQALAANGSTLFIAAGTSEAAAKVYRFDSASGALLGVVNDPVQGINYFGNTIAIRGSDLLVGARRTDALGLTDAGAAHVFDSSSGGFVRTLLSPTPVQNGRFGIEVALSDTVYVVADKSAVHVFDRSTGGFLRTIQPGAFSCFDLCSLAIDDQRLVIGSPATNAVFVYNTLTGALIAQLPPPVPGGNYFGEATAWFGDRVLVGAPRTDFVPAVGPVLENAGEAYLYALPPASTQTPAATASPATPKPTPTRTPSGVPSATPTSTVAATATPTPTPQGVPSATPPRDESIVASIEEPTCNGSSGISNIRGFAFTTRPDAEIQRLIEVIFDRGTDHESRTNIPCCSSRGDVAAGVPGAPQLSGFSGIFNWCLLSPGTHTITLVFKSSTGKTLTTTREFISYCEHPSDPFITQAEFSWRFGTTCSAGDGGSAVFSPAADICDGEVRYGWSQATQGLALRSNCVSDGLNPPPPPECSDDVVTEHAP